MSFCCDFLALMNQVAVHMHIVALLPASIFAIPMSHLSGILIAVTMAILDAQMCTGCIASRAPRKLDME